MCADRTDGPKVRRWLLALVLLALVGAADAGYLLWWHGRPGADRAGGVGSAFCPAKGCEFVNQGEYANVLGVPLAAIGLAGYLMILALSLLAAIRRGRRATQGIVMLSGVGVMVSAYLVYLQVAVIGAICSYCVVSAITMTSILVVALALLVKPDLAPGRSVPADRWHGAGEARGPASASGARRGSNGR
jgi:uncharacterized membrane protein